MELSRQRLRPALAESAYIPCPRCHGIGHIRGTESTSLHILRILQEEAMKDNTAQVVAQVPVDVATFLLNEKRNDVLSIETRFKVNVLLVPNRHLETPNYSIERMRHDDLNQGEVPPASFEMVEAARRDGSGKRCRRKPGSRARRRSSRASRPAQPAPVAASRPAPAIRADDAPFGRLVHTDECTGCVRRRRLRASPTPENAPAASLPGERARDFTPARAVATRRGTGGGPKLGAKGQRRDERRPDRERKDARAGDDTRRKGQSAIESQRPPGRKDGEHREARREREPRESTARWRGPTRDNRDERCANRAATGVRRERSPRRRAARAA
jgi:ribonuclease E